MRIAVVIPTLNESAHITATIRSLDAGRPDLVLVADCDSADDTAEMARAAGATVITGAGLNSRGAALRAGAERALRELDQRQADTASSDVIDKSPQADVVWFLHADTLAPPDWRDAIEHVLADPAVVGGAFTQRFTMTPPAPGSSSAPTTYADAESAKRLASPPPRSRPSHLQRRLLRFTTFANRTRYFFTGIYFGDQGLFARASALRQIDGVPALPLMEDVELCRQLKTVGQLRVSPVKLSTSPRRFLKHGVLRQLLRDWCLLLNHRCGRRPEKHHENYNADNHQHGNTSPV